MIFKSKKCKNDENSSYTPAIRVIRYQMASKKNFVFALESFSAAETEVDVISLNFAASSSKLQTILYLAGLL